MTTDFFTSPTLPLGSIDVGSGNLDLACDSCNGGAGSLLPVAGSDVVSLGGVVMRHRVAGALAVCRPGRRNTEAPPAPFSVTTLIRNSLEAWIYMKGYETGQRSR
jgi:hypothetical protein